MTFHVCKKNDVKLAYLFLYLSITKMHFKTENISQLDIANSEGKQDYIEQ